MRTPHILQRNKNNETVHEAIWFDTETKPTKRKDGAIEHHLWFGWACYRRRVRNGKWGKEHWWRFESRDEFWNGVFARSREKTKLWLFCHNTAFDLPVLDVFGWMARGGYGVKMACLESPPTVLQYRRDTRTITLVDTLNIWRMPLVDVGKQIGIPKLKMPDRNASRQAWDTYGKQDVRVIMQACILWWEMLIRLDMGGFSPTLAAQSMRAFRHRYMQHEIFIDCHEEGLKLSRSAYHGARTEAHYIGKAIGAFYLLDVNSMYPDVMSRSYVPIRHIGFTRRATVDDLFKWCQNACVVAEITMRTRTNFAPYRPEEKLLFPIGRFQCTLSTPEIEYALEHAEILKVHQVVVYDRAQAFQYYMLDLWERRVAAMHAGDTVLSTQLKTLANAFYGKWGQSGGVWEKMYDTKEREISYWWEVDADTNTRIKWRQFAGIVQRKSDAFESANSFPAIAAHVTAYARMKLFSLMQEAGQEHVFYCDTDSLLVDQTGYDRLLHWINPDALGHLKLEGVFDRIHIWGAKDYIFGSKVRQKGIRRDALVIGSNVYEQDKWLSFKGLLRAGITDRALTLRVRKQLRRTYEKGVIQADGRVLPFHYF